METAESETEEGSLTHSTCAIAGLNPAIHFGGRKDAARVKPGRYERGVERKKRLMPLPGAAA